MKTLLSLAVVLCLCAGTGLAQDVKKVGIEESKVTKDGFVDVERMTEYEFLSSPDTPKLYPMDKALEVSKITNKPVLCWMGKNVFADANVRKLSQQLKDDTIQASMEKDPVNPKYDQFNPRVKFDSANYVDGGKTYFIQSRNFRFESPTIPLEKTTAYELRKVIHEKGQPAGKDPLAK